MNTKEIKKAVDILKNDGVIIFPTDTVWGIGASAASVQGIKRLYTLKNRSLSQPTAILVKDLDQAIHYGDFSPQATQLAHSYWPGALTLIVPATAHTPKVIRGEGNTVGLRVPDSRLVQEIAQKLGEGIVASSANTAGAPPPKKRGELEPQLVKKADYTFFTKEEEARDEKPSTIIDATTEKIVILRRGGVTIKK